MFNREGENSMKAYIEKLKSTKQELIKREGKQTYYMIMIPLCIMLITLAFIGITQLTGKITSENEYIYDTCWSSIYLVCMLVILITMIRGTLKQQKLKVQK